MVLNDQTGVLIQNGVAGLSSNSFVKLVGCNLAVD